MAEKTLENDWRLVKLSDVVRNIDEFVDRSSGEVWRYVAGEHIDEGQLRVARQGLSEFLCVR